MCRPSSHRVSAKDTPGRCAGVGPWDGGGAEAAVAGVDVGVDVDVGAGVGSGRRSHRARSSRR